MKIRRLVKAFAVAMLMASGAVAEKPNFVIVLADDVSWSSSEY